MNKKKEPMLRSRRDSKDGNSTFKVQENAKFGKEISKKFKRL